LLPTAALIVLVQIAFTVMPHNLVQNEDFVLTN
jgi:hypothetical protein